MLDVIYLCLGLCLAVYFAVIMGANDAANSSAQPVGSGIMSMRAALTTFAIAAALGAVVQGYMVITTVGKGVVKPIGALDAILASAAAVAWITIATYLKLPISTTHSIVSAVLGIGIARIVAGDVISIKWDLVQKIVLSWVFSPASSIALSLALYHLFRLLAITAIRRGWSVTKIFAGLVIAGHLWGAYSFGANDVANATGVYVTVAKIVIGTYVWSGLDEMTTMRLLSLIGALGIAVGGFWWGWRVISTVAYRITRLGHVTAAAAIWSYAAVVWLFTTVPAILIGYGMPISTTYVAVSAIAGAGIASNGLRGVSWKTLAVVFASWVVTLPAACGLSALLHLVAYRLIPEAWIV